MKNNAKNSKSHERTNDHARSGERSNPLTVSKKHFQKDGKWIVKPFLTEVLVCACGAKYIKTRDSQIVCVRCMYKPA